MRPGFDPWVGSKGDAGALIQSSFNLSLLRDFTQMYSLLPLLAYEVVLLVNPFYG